MADDRYGNAARLKPLRVRTCGDPLLRQRSGAVDEITPEIRALAARMVVTMFENETRGIGLAAPQVGHSIRLITLATQHPSDPLPVDASPGECLLCARMPLALVNPEIVSASSVAETASEGCLSVPELYGEVTRPRSVVLRATTLDGEHIQVECGGLLARCLQHEIDHLDGILFIDRLSREEADALASNLRALEKRTKREIKREHKRAGAG